MQGLVHACACGCGGSGFGAAWLDRGATLQKLLQVRTGRTGSHLQVSLPVPVLLILIINFVVLHLVVAVDVVEKALETSLTLAVVAVAVLDIVLSTVTCVTTQLLMTNQHCDDQVTRSSSN